MKNEIIQRLVLPCRIIDVTLKVCKNGSRFVLCKLGTFDNGEFICSRIINNESAYNKAQENMYNKKRHTIERVTLRPHNLVYHILTWDDVDRKLCTREHIGEVQRDKDGKPIMFNQIVVYTNINNKHRLTINEILDKEYIEINSPFAQKALEFNNRSYFLQKLEEKRNAQIAKQEEEYNEMMDLAYEAYENRRFAEMNMSEEDRIMDALENGDGELYGF